MSTTRRGTSSITGQLVVATFYVLRSFVSNVFLTIMFFFSNLHYVGTRYVMPLYDVLLYVMVCSRIDVEDGNVR
jgi:hypothetical protein